MNQKILSVDLATVARMLARRFSELATTSTRNCGCRKRFGELAGDGKLEVRGGLLLPDLQRLGAQVDFQEHGADGVA